MRSWQIIALMLCGSLMFSVGCSNDADKNNKPGNDVEVDAGDDVGNGDVGEDADPGDQDVDPGDQDVDPGDQDVDPGDQDVDPGECEEFCGDSSVVIESADGEFPLTHAVYGLTSPEVTGDGWEVHVELWEGGFEGCPLNDSPSPSRTLILSGLSLNEADELVMAEKLALTLLDFEGLVFVEDKEIPFIKAVSVTATADSWEFCTDCLTDSTAEGKNGELVMKLEAAFEKGSLHGEMRAQHCESMDWLQ